MAELPSEYKPVWHDIPTAFKDTSLAPSVPTSTAQAAQAAHSSHAYTGVSVGMGYAEEPLPPPQRLCLLKVRELQRALRLLAKDTSGVKKVLQERLYEALGGNGAVGDTMVDMAALSARESGEFTEMDAEDATQQPATSTSNETRQPPQHHSDGDEESEIETQSDTSKQDADDNDNVPVRATTTRTAEAAASKAKASATQAAKEAATQSQPQVQPPPQAPAPQVAEATEPTQPVAADIPAAQPPIAPPQAAEPTQPPPPDAAAAPATATSDDGTCCVCMQVTSANDTNVVLLCSEENCPWECHIACYTSTTGQQEPAGMWYCKECSDEAKSNKWLMVECILSHSGSVVNPRYEVKWWGHGNDDTSTETPAKMKSLFKTQEEAAHYKQYRQHNFLEEFASIERILSHQHTATTRIKYKVLWRNNGTHSMFSMITTEPAAKVTATCSSLSPSLLVCDLAICICNCYM